MEYKGSSLDDNQMPAADDAPKSRTDISPRQVSETQKFEGKDETGHDGSLSSFVSMTRLRPFLALFEAYAVRSFPKRRSARSCVDAMMDQHRWLFQVCFWADFLFTAALCVGILLVLGINIYHLAF
ncbi:hypothetical protein [Arcanobacterium pinnipediorum]|uniref:Uncharacterized protein n=1 Tax=Arcanobacterium pinnipediorum TaxID=1503041 RepID=A0ABY5AH08_9ACTO|nr:hypothetical protein [Arcanobacterium pinnipediorum]USR79372.1 hypothetical protein NG665_08385 [Arcanobacterium pinnipediorum]